MPILGLLGLMFIGLKLAGVIGWSWLWVLAPFWAVFALIIAIFAVPFMGILTVAGLAWMAEKKR
jgi:hypothetical protein